MLTARINNLYLHDHGKIILFNSKEEIDYFVNGLISYCITHGLAEGLNIAQAITLGNNIIVEEWKDPKFCTCETIKYEDLRK